MKKAVLAILALGFITSASAYSWNYYYTGSGAWRWPFISAERDSLKRQPINCYYDFNQHRRVCFND
ncbi:hypothetical protein AVANS14531_08965 [Campylobacter sp. Cr9]|uniref:hypothetical protein n=1 Tax=unclassified Campylobacter TaxID=2593542 RepID=UPI001EFB59BF|nr:hypothetical protein [Campylobacter sp. RM5004]MBZ7986467.1 hypothetical protein [Campylobacter sp. Cr9]ULO00961.1 hypothetical protein AVANS_0320 [Campylobacter sp. RM5004]